ncbi:hypothetical protein VCRA2116O29_110101 [Vibrio crassostreae]|nr:hypothetical protein VCRA2116O29_110101 [Vibrio crassostreae]CAK3562865.1 hypothetical protein VCRA2123O74_110001 [Vibrio crassostreae]
MNQNDYIGKTLKPWPILVDHYNNHFYQFLLSGSYFIGFLSFLEIGK